MPSRRLTSVAAAMAPDDLSICDIARKAKAQSPKSKVQSACDGAFVLVACLGGAQRRRIVLVLVIESGSKSRIRRMRANWGCSQALRRNAAFMRQRARTI